MSEDYKTIKLTGKVYIKDYNDNTKINKGDLRLYMNIEKNIQNENKYNLIGIAGYLKGEVFDGKFWQLIDMEEFFYNREYKFSKKEMPIDTASLCVALLENESRDQIIYRSYRGHYTRDEYVKEERENKYTKKKRSNTIFQIK